MRPIAAQHHIGGKIEDVWILHFLQDDTAIIRYPDGWLGEVYLGNLYIPDEEIDRLRGERCR